MIKREQYDSSLLTLFIEESESLHVKYNNLLELANDKFPVLKSKLKEIIKDEDTFIFQIGEMLRPFELYENFVPYIVSLREDILAYSSKIDRYLPLLLDDDDNQSIKIIL